MPAWDFSATDLLFPLAVIAIWAGLFLMVMTVCRWAAHDHDGEAGAQEAAVQEALGHPAGPAPAAHLPT